MKQASINSRRGIAGARDAQHAAELEEDLGDNEALDEGIWRYCNTNLISKEYKQKGMYKEYNRRLFMQYTRSGVKGNQKVSHQQRGFSTMLQHWEKDQLTYSIKRANRKANKQGYTIDHVELVRVLVKHIQRECDGEDHPWDYKTHLTNAGMTVAAHDALEKELEELNRKYNSKKRKKKRNR